MRALVKQEPKRGLWLQDVARPKIGANDILIKISKTAICGTDLHIYLWDEWSQSVVKTPRVIGHEFVGIVESCGSAVDSIKVGDRVSGEGHITCEQCRNCRAGKRHLCRNTIGTGVERDGAFADYLSLPASNAFKIADSISDDLASIFDPYGNAVHTALSFDLVGEDVLITGAGPVGLMGVAIAKHVGARHVVITDVNDYRLEIAKAMGATRVVRADKESLTDVMSELGMNEGFDVGFEMSGHPDALTQMISLMNHGGQIALLGIIPKNVAINWPEVIFKGLILKGIYGREMYETWYKMASMLQSGLDLSPVITHHFPMEHFEEGFELLETGLAAKVILDWT